MAERLNSEEMTEPPSDDTPSTSGQTSRQTHRFDDVILKVAKAISDDGDVMRLGVELGVQIADINRALETNWAGGRKTSNGNVMLLQNWAETVKPSKQLSILRAALQAADFKEIEETCLQRKGEFKLGDIHVSSKQYNLIRILVIRPLVKCYEVNFVQC
eukprot:XP_011680865.1 PREDICTED: uncharacterized protein LOC100892927 [Strongylocentrotus purpuratus]